MTVRPVGGISADFQSLVETTAEASVKQQEQSDALSGEMKLLNDRVEEAFGTGITEGDV